MKLYYSPGTCSLSPHIALCEAGVKFDLVPTSLRTHTLADGSDFYAISAKGQVPLLELDDGERLTEGTVILQYIADHAPGSGLAPPAGTLARYRLMEWLNFIATELHKTFSPLFNPTLPPAAKDVFAKRLKEKFAYVDARLAGNDYLMGDRFCVADAYLYTMTTWAEGMKVDLSGLANVVAFHARMGARPAVKQALATEAKR